METVSQYEVVCPRCNVTFPVGTRTCIHCGGRTVASHVNTPDRPPQTREAAELELGRQQTPGEPHPIDIFEEEEEVAVQGSSKMRALVTVIWILLAVGFSLARACNEG